MRWQYSLLLFGAVLCALAPAAAADVIMTVGPKGQYATIAKAVAAADNDTNASHHIDIYVAPGTYKNDFPNVTRAMTISVNPSQAGQQVLLDATEALPNEKGIILTTASLTVDGLTFEGAEIPNSEGGNGAGIRDQNTGAGASLIVENSIFTGNQEGILTGYDSSEAVEIIGSKFLNNGNPSPLDYQHALYVNYAGSLTVSSSLFCGQLIGHDIKSRAAATTVENSQIYDGAADAAVGCRAGSTSFGIDIPNGGVATITGDQIIQGAATENYKLIDYGEEGLLYSDNSILLAGDTLTSIGTPNATGLYDPNCVTADLRNDTLNNVTTPVNPSNCVVYQSVPSVRAAALILAADDPPPVSEPGTFWLLLPALTGLAAVSRRAKSTDAGITAP